MRRLTACILTFALCISLCVLPASASNEKYQSKAVSLLAGLDILRGDENGDYLLSKSVNRAEFTTFIIRMMGLEEVSVTGDGESSIFSDVPDEHWAAGVIATASKMELIQGVGGGLFEPDRGVTLDEAVKILVTTLGYKSFAEKSGGFPGGYNKMASDLKLYKNLEVGSGKIDRAAVCMLVYNALTADVYNELTGLTDRTALEEFLDLETVRGTVTATVGYQRERKLDGEIMLDGVAYECNDTLADDYIGMQAICYIYDDGDNKVVYHVQPIKDYETVTVEAEDIEPTTNLSEFEYADEEGDVESLSLYGEPSVFYNGMILPKEELSDSILKPAVGSVTLRDGDSDGKFETILLNVYVDYVVNYISEDIVYAKFGKTLDLLKPDSLLILRNGEEISPAEIQNGDVLSVMQSRDGKRVKIAVSDDKTDGYIAEIAEEGDGNTLYTLKESQTEELVAFKLDEEYKAALKSNHIDTVSLSVSDDNFIRIYYNAFGLVADISTLAEADEYSYGYLIAVDRQSEGIDDEVSFKIMTLANRFEVFEAREGEDIKYGRSSGNQYVVTEMDAGSVAAAVSGKRIVKYKLDSEGYLTEIHRAGTVAGSEYFSRDSESDMLLTYRDGVFGDKYYIDQNTAVFSVNNSYDYIMSAGKYTAFLNNGAAKYCTFYDVEGSYAKALVINAPAVTVYNDTLGGGYEIILDYVNSPIFYIDTITTKLTENGESYMQLNGFQDGEPKEILVANELKPNSEARSNLKPGIAIQYEDNGIHIDYAETSDTTRQLMVFKTVHDFTVPSDEDIFWEYEKVMSTRSMITTMWGNVDHVSGDYCTISVGSDNYTAKIHENTMILRYDSDKRRFTQTTADAINTGMSLFMRQRYQNTREAVIY